MDHLPDALRYVDGPYALAGLALLVVAGFTQPLMKNVLDRKARRLLSFSLLALGGITILGSLLLANSSRRPPMSMQPRATRNLSRCMARVMSSAAVTS